MSYVHDSRKNDGFDSLYLEFSLACWPARLSSAPYLQLYFDSYTERYFSDYMQKNMCVYATTYIPACLKNQKCCTFGSTNRENHSITIFGYSSTSQIIIHIYSTKSCSDPAYPIFVNVSLYIYISI